MLPIAEGVSAMTVTLWSVSLLRPARTSDPTPLSVNTTVKRFPMEKNLTYVLAVSLARSKLHFAYDAITDTSCTDRLTAMSVVATMVLSGAQDDHACQGALMTVALLAMKRPTPKCAG